MRSIYVNSSNMVNIENTNVESMLIPEYNSMLSDFMYGCQLTTNKLFKFSTF